MLRDALSLADAYRRKNKDEKFGIIYNLLYSFRTYGSLYEKDVLYKLVRWKYFLRKKHFRYDNDGLIYLVFFLVNKDYGFYDVT
jgi:hypothetical protein